MEQTHLELHEEELGLLKKMIGQVFNSYICDEFLFTPSSFQVVYLVVGGKTYALENSLRVVDYYGAPEDVAVFTLSQWDKPCESRIMNRNTTTTPIKQEILDIELVTDTETMSENGIDVQCITTTKAIIFKLPDRQVVFEKDIWFSENINIYRGKDVQSKIAPPGEDAEGEPPVEFRAERTVTTLSSKR